MKRQKDLRKNSTDGQMSWEKIYVQKSVLVLVKDRSNSVRLEFSF